MLGNFYRLFSGVGLLVWDLHASEGSCEVVVGPCNIYEA